MTWLMWLVGAFCSTFFWNEPYTMNLSKIGFKRGHTGIYNQQNDLAVPENRVYQYNYGYRYSRKITIEVGKLSFKTIKFGSTLCAFHLVDTWGIIPKNKLHVLVRNWWHIIAFSWEYVLTSNRLAMIRLWLAICSKRYMLKPATHFPDLYQVDQTVDQRKNNPIPWILKPFKTPHMGHQNS